MRITLAILLAVFALPVFATNLTLNWTAPTTFADNVTPIPSGTAITFNVYGAAQGSPLVLLTPGITSTTNIRTNVNPGAVCYAVTAVVAGQESAQTVPVCVTVAPAPAPPGGLTVTPVTTSTIAYMLVPGANTYGVLIVGSAPLGTPCDVTKPVLTYFVIPWTAVTYNSSLQPKAVLGYCS